MKETAGFQRNYTILFIKISLINLKKTFFYLFLILCKKAQVGGSFAHKLFSAPVSLRQGPNIFAMTLRQTCQ